jgi:cysteinyl-tRNA synthetase
MGDEQLKMLMENYKSQVELNTKLLEQQKWFLTRLEESTNRLVEAIHAQTTGIQGSIEIETSRLGQKMTEDHGGLRIQIYVALVGMVSILATLITLWVVK